MFIRKNANELPQGPQRCDGVSTAIFPHMTVRENIGFGLTIAKTPRPKKTAKSKRLLVLQMEHLLDRRPINFGGQRQRVAIGQAIIANQRCFYLTNLSQTLMRRCAWICG